MDFYQVKGGYNFSGQIRCGGAKNLSIKAIIATLLSDNISILENIPDILDIKSIKHLLNEIGVKFEHNKDVISIDAGTINNFIIKENKDVLYGRTTILLLAALMHRSDIVSVPKMDGCKFGPRSTDFHFDILSKFGIKMSEEENQYIAKKTSKLVGQKITLPFPSVGATEFGLLISVLAEGISVLDNVATEPEILCLISLLQQMGAKIHWTGKSEITIEGVKTLYGANYRIISDRIETASWAVLAACSDGSIDVHNVDNIEYLSTFLGIYQRMGGGFQRIPEGIRFFRREKLKSISIETGAYPIFSTDYQPMLTLMMSQADGISSVHETLFEDRLAHLKNLNKFGVKSDVVTNCIGSPCQFHQQNHKHSAFVCGNAQLIAPDEIIESENLRSGMTYLIAGCLAKGISKIGNIHLIGRGYENILEKLRSLNIDINLIKRGEK
ncbi:UDP-N-acetylglucosamine 1-carboxyvinyltransferase [Candidatus Cytomitobacter indipagum]|uniref:UDP-N-acetylglucosamine 1-carboxyvinyltransferase n=1 Tax=Candidatus Cytomitobacter indipagum TaxID=2601575 RepID=A0A5C0UE00_9PROT|nr:UDP-N-acetylglucosamine 1-carboxyvinyltransferase [Candidatus Cytomitobacter indipagum]QEK37930.1 UDP-N-acetylglucosamine 1-carboxyvinyltransferase [Candidatus Cytomitobacter indipagum]